MPVPATRLASLDLAVVALYLIGITVFGLRFSKRSKIKGNSLQSYFLAGNTIPWWAISLSIVSAETSTLTIISIPGVAFTGNFGFLQIVLGYLLGRGVVALLFLPKYFQGSMLTAYQFIDRRFGPTLHKVTASLFLLTRAAAEGVRVFAISIVVGIAIGTGDTLSIAIISGLTLLYTFEGGMAAVIWTDVVQMALYVAGTVVALITLGRQVPGNWPAILAQAAPAGKLHLFKFALNLTESYTFWAGILGGTFLTMASHGTDQLMVQRMLAARSLRESRLALLSSGAVIFLQFTLFLLIGTGLWVYSGQHPGLGWATTAPDRLFPLFIVQHMPHGIAGLLVAAILAAAMSNLSAALNSLSSTSVVDFYMHLRPDAKDRERTVISRTSTVFWAFVLFTVAVYAIQHGGKGHVVETGLSIASVAYGCLLGVFLLGTLTRFATQTGAILGMITGFLFNLILWLTPANGGWTYTTPEVTRYIAFPHIAFTWYVFLGTLVTFAVGSLASLIFRKQSGSRRTAIAAAVALAFLCVVPAGSGRLHAQTTETKAQIYYFTSVSTLITQAIADKKLPGAVVLIGHNGQVVFEQAYGNRKLAGEPGLDGKPSPAEPMTLDTIFDMASLTKVLVTGVAVMQLVEQGKLDLDTPVAHYLPGFAANGKQSITVRQLLTHYSGLPEDISLKDDWGLKSPDKAEGIRRALAAVPYGPPGQTFKYSDINFITLGALVEQISGAPLNAGPSALFRILNMNSADYHSYGQSCGPIALIGSAFALPPPAEPICKSRFVRGSAGATQVEGGCSTLVTDYGCGSNMWDSYLISRGAPTAHDNEGTALTNPDFDHLLRGTVHDPTARRMGGVAGHAGVFATAQDTALFAQALLDKLLYNTGPFPLTQASLQRMTTPQQPATAHADATVFTPDGQTTKGVAVRGLGWDINSPFSRPRGEIFPISTTQHPGSFGHTGFTGTSLWIDATSETYVILLANAIHPRGGAPISTLRGQVATAAARALGLPAVTKSDLPQGPGPHSNVLDVIQPSHPESHSRDCSTHIGLDPGPYNCGPTLTGIDVLELTRFAALKSLAQAHNGHLRLGLLTNQSGLDAQGRRTIDILLHADPTLQLTTLFSPEHGLSARQDTEHLATESDPLTHLPILSLYGPKPADKHPKQSDLKQLDAVVIDLQDAGVRFWTYETLLGYFLEASAKAHIPVIVLDRPNPVGGLATQGPVSDLGSESYTNFMSLPVRHGLTFGELAQYFNAQATEIQLKPELLDAQTVIIGTDTPTNTPPATRSGLHAQLTVIPMQHWRRDEFFAQTGLTWTPPSPNLRTPTAAILYPALGLTEQTNISVGRGTPTPFEHLGASWIDAHQLATYLTQRQIPGIEITPTTLTIAEDANHYPFHGQTVPGIAFHTANPALLDSPELGLELLAALHHLYPAQFQLTKARTLLANAETLAALERGDDPRAITARYAAALAAYQKSTAPYRLYPLLQGN